MVFTLNTLTIITTFLIPLFSQFTNDTVNEREAEEAMYVAYLTIETTQEVQIKEASTVLLPNFLFLFINGIDKEVRI